MEEQIGTRRIEAERLSHGDTLPPSWRSPSRICAVAGPVDERFVARPGVTGSAVSGAVRRRSALGQLRVRECGRLRVGGCSTDCVTVRICHRESYEPVWTKPPNRGSTRSSAKAATNQRRCEPRLSKPVGGACAPPGLRRRCVDSSTTRTMAPSGPAAMARHGEHLRRVARVTRGEVYRVTLPAVRGREQRGPGYGVIVQAEALLGLSTILIAPTSRSAGPRNVPPRGRDRRRADPGTR